MNKYKVIAICGKSASGKDTLLRNVLLQHPYLHKIINTTTRPPRESEVDGKDYYFISVEAFAHADIMGKMIETAQFREWFYGTSIDALDPNEINVGVFNPTGIACLMERDDIDLYVVQVVASDKNRLLRSLHREESPDVDEIVRRYFADKKDFEMLSQIYEPDYLFDNDDLLTERAAREIVLFAQRHWAEETN